MLSEDLDPGLSRGTAVREGSELCLASLAQTLALLGTLQNARSQAECQIAGAARAWRGRAGQAFELGEPGVVDRDHRQFTRRGLPRAATG